MINYIGSIDINDGKIKFGTGGWRAVIGDDYTRANICRVANAIAIFQHYLDYQAEKPEDDDAAEKEEGTKVERKRVWKGNTF